MSKPKPTTSPVQIGTVTGIEDHGTIVIVRLTTAAGLDFPIFFDHRPFHWLLEGEGCMAQELLGRLATYDGESLNFSV
jgi:hypothetical protein